MIIKTANAEIGKRYFFFTKKSTSPSSYGKSWFSSSVTNEVISGWIVNHDSYTTEVGWRDGEKTLDINFKSNNKPYVFGAYCELFDLCYPYEENIQTSAKNSSAITIAQAINDFTCPTCNNNRCSKSERICWKCGNKL